MATPVTKQLGEHTFIIGFIPAMKAPKVFKQLAAVAGPFVSELGDLLKAHGDADIEKALSGGKLDGLVKKMVAVDDAALLEVMLTLAQATTLLNRNGNLAGQFDLIFTGNLDIMVRWFIEAVKVNFASFSKLTETANA